MASDINQHGTRRVRIALLAGAFAPVAEYAVFCADGIRCKAWAGDLRAFFVVPAILGFVAVTVGILAVWFLGYRVVRIISQAVRVVAFRGVPLEDWTEATAQGLWLFPYAAGLGAVLWLVYSFGGFGGWPDDVVFSTIGILLGLGCGAALMCAWLRSYRAARAAVQPRR